MKLSNIFTSGAVFKAGSPIRIFGTGAGCGVIEFSGIKRRVCTNEDFWTVELPAMEYGGPYELIFESDGERVALNDIYVGEVYLFAGQSNMAFPISATNTAAERREENDSLHLFTVPFDPAENASWKRATREVIEDFSALGYLVGNDVTKKVDAHVGIILCARGASSIRSWLPAGTFERLGIDIPHEKLHRDHFGEYGAWNSDGYLYGRMMFPIVPYAISGIVWYQGESNAAEGEAEFYECELRELIRIWRDNFNDADLPITIVQIADTHERMSEGTGWQTVQAAQESAARNTDNAYLVISRDISETDDVHPKTKALLADRISAVINNIKL